MSSHSWLRTDMSANRWQQTYFKNFVDISGDLYVRKGGISAGANASEFTVNSNGDISANSLNINVFTANTLSATTLSGTLDTVNQPNITSVGTLSSLDVSGNISAPNFQNSGDVTFKSTSGATSLEASSTISLKTNSQSRMFIKSDGSVGIGTNNPLYILDVSEYIKAHNGIKFGFPTQAANLDSWTIEANSSKNLVFSVDSNPSSSIIMKNINSNGFCTLDVSGHIRAKYLHTAGYVNLTHQSLPQGGYVGWNDDNGGGRMDFISSRGDGFGGFSFFNIEDNAATDSNEPILTINSGSIIGPPTGNFHVKGPNETGTTYFESSGNVVLKAMDGAHIDGNTIHIRTHNDLENYTERITILNNGYVGIGKSPVTNLDVVGTIQASGDINAIGTIKSGSTFTSDASDTLFQGTRNTHLRAENGAILFVAGTSPAIERMRVNTNGNVGIGTSSPSEKLNVSGNISINAFVSTDSHGGRLFFDQASDVEGPNKIDLWNSANIHGFGVEGATTSYHTAQYHKFYTNNGTERALRMTIHNDKVGIGISSPTAKLHVDGNIVGHSNSLLANSTAQDKNLAAHAVLTLKNFRETSLQYGAPCFTMNWDSAGDTPAFWGFGQGATTNVTAVGSASTGHSSTMGLGYSASGNYGWSPKFFFTTLGHLGIGTARPDYDLTIISNNTHIFGSGSNYHLSYGGTGGGAAYGQVHASVYADDSYITNGHFFAYSDRRIKTNITDINDDIALQQLRLIQPKTYEYVDKIHRTNETVFGFIAQDVHEVITNAVSTTKGIIPNIFKLANVSMSDDDDYNIINFTDFDTSDLDASSNIIQVIASNNAKHAVNISEVIDSNTIRVDTNLSEWMGAIDTSNQSTIPNTVHTYNQVILDASNNVILENYDISTIASMDASENVVGQMADLTGDNIIDSSGNYVDASGNIIAAINADGHYIDASGNYFDASGNFKDASGTLIGTYKAQWKKVTINGNKIFVYGQKVDDLYVLNKDAIFTVATAALQEVDRQLQAEKAKVATLESQMADLLARVTALEST